MAKMLFVFHSTLPVKSLPKNDACNVIGDTASYQSLKMTRHERNLYLFVYVSYSFVYMPYTLNEIKQKHNLVPVQLMYAIPVEFIERLKCHTESAVNCRCLIRVAAHQMPANLIVITYQSRYVRGDRPGGYSHYFLTECAARGLKPLPISKDFSPSKNG